MATLSNESLLTHYLAGIRITEELLPLFERHKVATVIDISLLTLGFIKKPNLMTSIKTIRRRNN